MVDSRAKDTLLPSFASEEDNVEGTAQQQFTTVAARKRPFLVGIAGKALGIAQPLDGAEVTVGRAASCVVCVDDPGVSRTQARVFVDERGDVVIEDLKSANGTHVNGVRVTGAVLRDGDQIQLAPGSIFRFSMLDAHEERYHGIVRASVSSARAGDRPPPSNAKPWSPDGWKTKPIGQAPRYDDLAAVERVVKKLKKLPPLVTSWEIEDLKRQIADAQEGHRFLLQGGDCAEVFDECEPTTLSNKLKILLQMSLVLVKGGRRPIIRVGRFAGQYAKPRSKATEIRGGVELPSYLGDIVNRAEFSAAARRPDPELLVQGYFHAAVTLNYIRSLSGGGLSDLRRPEYFDLFFKRADLPNDLRLDYQRLSRELSDGLHFLQAIGDRGIDELMRVNFFTSHEGLNLIYESAQTRQVPRSDKFYDLTTHLPWIGERTRALDGAHVDFFRGVANPVGVKIGPTASPQEVVELVRTLNPDNEPGKIVLICRFGVQNVAAKLPLIVEAIKEAQLRVLWVSDPMHGNAIVSASGVKTRNFDDILREVELSMDVHAACETYFGGVHFELTGDDVTECIGGGLGEDDLSTNYATLCDPRLNYRQAVQIAFLVSKRLTESRPPATLPPPPPSSRR